jgi:hypothetical protein
MLCTRYQLCMCDDTLSGLNSFLCMAVATAALTFQSMLPPPSEQCPWDLDHWARWLRISLLHSAVFAPQRVAPHFAWLSIKSCSLSDCLWVFGNERLVLFVVRNSCTKQSGQVQRTNLAAFWHFYFIIIIFVPRILSYVQELPTNASVLISSLFHLAAATWFGNCVPSSGSSPVPSKLHVNLGSGW